LFLALIFPRKDQSMLILLLLILEPPRLAKTRTKMKPKFSGGERFYYIASSHQL
jgi:hypothetical protein